MKRPTWAVFHLYPECSINQSNITSTIQQKNLEFIEITSANPTPLERLLQKPNFKIIDMYQIDQAISTR